MKTQNHSRWNTKKYFWSSLFNYRQILTHDLYGLCPSFTIQIPYIIQFIFKKSGWRKYKKDRYGNIFWSFNSQLWSFNSQFFLPITKSLGSDCEESLFTELNFTLKNIRFTLLPKELLLSITNLRVSKRIIKTYPFKHSFFFFFFFPFC